MVWVREINVRGPAGGIDPTDPEIMAAVRDAAEDAVAEEVQEIGALVGFPTDAPRSSTRTTLPISWTNRVLNDPYPEIYPDLVEGTWENGWRYHKSIPLLSDVTGRIPPELISESIARVSQIPDVSDIEAIVSQIPRVETRVRPELPILGGRVAAGAADNAPVPIGIASSSTFARSPGPGARLLSLIQSAYPVASQSLMQWSGTADFTVRTGPGIHAYNAGVGGAQSADYLPDDVLAKLADLNLAALLHVVGSNDYTSQVDPNVYKANILDRIEAYDAAASGPCQHILVHAYARKNFTPPTFEHHLYGDALREIADEYPTAVFIDYSAPFVALGVPGADPLGLVDTDNIHPTVRGNRLIADVVSAGIVI